jgi:type III restriction enzyme
VRFSLKDFQVTAADDLMAKLQTARDGAARKQPQAVVLSSPTGSGKTVIVIEMMERILRGHEGMAGDPNAIFLWLSDSPKLNEQSKNKIEEASDEIVADRLVPVDHPFNYERLVPGRVYFLNTQKLGASSLLVKAGDKQNWTIWQIVENTARAMPRSFYLIIDEAHRGMLDAGKSQAARTKAENNRLTIVQKFVKGDKAVGLSPVPLIVGISATPDRFYAVLRDSGRTQHPVTVEPEQVRGSGLIKDRIKLAVAEKGDQADWSMLAEAGRKWVSYGQEWASYCKDNHIPAIEPVLVVQVENGTDSLVTKTDLATCVNVLQKACGTFPSGALANCFENDGDFPAGAIHLLKIDLSRIQDDPDLRVVFFKTALTTGWDCPRAEVMMSFRKAVDDTLIAQLVGRMVRTPLARRVETNEFLNSVSLSLPHYDEKAVDDIIKKLQDPAEGGAGEVVKEKEMALYRRAEDKADLFAALAKVPTYVVDRPRRICNSSRLIKLARLLTRNTAAQELQERARRFVIESLLEQRQRLAKDPEWVARVENLEKVPVKEFTIEYGEWKLGIEPVSYFIQATDENIYAWFQRCSGILGEGLHESYANRTEFRGDINTARLELVCILQDEKALKLVQQTCEREFDRLWREHKDDIEDLLPLIQEKFKELRRRGGSAAPESMTVVDAIEIRNETPHWEHHLFVSSKGKFGWNADSWEKPVLEREMERSGFSGFLRNMSRKPWALCIPYGSENDQALFPDLLVFHRRKGKVSIDILDPHGDHLADHLIKAQGLARYAKQHGEHFGRIEMIRLVKGKPERLDMQDEKIRGKVLKFTTVEQLKDLYEEFG